MRSNKIKIRYIILIILLLIVVLANIFNKNNEYLYKFSAPSITGDISGRSSSIIITNNLQIKLKAHLSPCAGCGTYSDSVNLYSINFYILMLIIIEIKELIEKKSKISENKNKYLKNNYIILIILNVFLLFVFKYMHIVFSIPIFLLLSSEIKSLDNNKKSDKKYGLIAIILTIISTIMLTIIFYFIIADVLIDSFSYNYFAEPTPISIPIIQLHLPIFTLIYSIIFLTNLPKTKTKQTNIKEE